MISSSNDKKLANQPSFQCMPYFNTCFKCEFLVAVP